VSAPAPARAYLAAGSNLAPRRRTILSALRALDASAGVMITALSSIVETDAQVPPGAPPQGAYLNAVVRVTTTLGPRALLDRCLAIEAAHGRVRAPGERWAARPIDLDLLLYADEIVDEPGLRVPHPRMLERWFVLAPLAEIAARVIHPGAGRPIESLRDDLVRRLPRCVPPSALLRRSPRPSR
jgi:2-amino-4-hydroxy-6-hydroxymethyldihydropteridine diphosphokinase